MRAARLVALAGGVCTALLAWRDPREAAFAWLAAYVWAVGIVLGALVLGMMATVAPIRWIAALRPAVDALARCTFLLVPLFLPVATALPWLYPWASPAALPADLRALLDARGVWLAPAFVLVRAVLYLGVWVALARALTAAPQPRTQTAPPASLEPPPPWAASASLSAAGLVLVGITWTFAAFDWVMSLDVQWNSMVYGPYLFAGGFSAGLAATILLARACEGAGLVPALPPDLFHALGRLLFAFLILWTYLFWVQLLIVWIAQLPDEALHLSVRLHYWAGWLWVLLIAHFAVPCALLLSRRLKRDRRWLGGIAVLVLLAHALDALLLVIPSLHPDGSSVLWLDVAPFLAIGGLLAAGTLGRLVPVPDALLRPSLAYRSP